MERRGHDVVWPADAQGRADVKRLAGCDLVHVYRSGDDETWQALRQLSRLGTPLTYDNDDDFTAIAKESPTYSSMSGARGRRLFEMTVRVAQLARCFTTTTQAMAEKYRRAGIERIEVIGNYLAPDVTRPRIHHDGVVIGWIAGIEHQADAQRLRIADVFERLLAKHPTVHLESIGVNLGLKSHYRHDPHVPFPDLPGRIGGFDIGIAPLADIPMNWGRSDIKLKEYAASGVPWLASPIGPYAELGERQGGRLVADDEWFEALERLVTKPRERRRLARTAKRWAKHQTIEAAADRWEHVFLDAAR
jgi:glycosyltransferase involved in cell wall biosynthesis